MSKVLLTTQLPRPRKSGKVRDIYDLGDHLLIVATDRISAYDVVMNEGIPQKGAILTQLSLFWFDRLQGVKNHLIGARLSDLPAYLHAHADDLAGRCMVVRKASVIPIECVARGYLAGSGWVEYQKMQTVCGVALPPRLTQCAKLPEPIFTPATKAVEGHDENISFDQCVEIVGEAMANKLKSTTLDLYRQAASYAETRGMLLADTKFEFGMVDDELILIDEVLTPDSSRYWEAAKYEPGHDQDSFDKQYVRNYLSGLDWDRTPPPPTLPADIVEGTRERYLKAYKLLSGKGFHSGWPT